MTLKLTSLVAAMMIASFGVVPQALAGDHGHGHDEHQEEAKGPNGGKMIEQGDFDLEITVFETGIPPEMRVFAYSKGEPVDPSQVNLSVVLSRLGGAVNNLSFTPENGYLVSNQVVTEPHSFDVDVSANFAGKAYQWSYENHEGRTTINDRLIKLSEIGTETAISQPLTFTDELFGIVAPIASEVFAVNAPYQGIIQRLHVNIGDRVKKGQVIATVVNNDTLQSYQVTSPASGEVTEQLLNAGDRTNASAIVTITNTDTVWVELSAFPDSLEKLAVGMPMVVADMHGGEQVETELSYIAPVMTGGHIARARAVIDNRDGHWRPGMHVKAQIQTRTKQAPLAVKVSALQKFRDMDVVFAKYGNTFEVRMVELGERAGDYVEVLAGLEPGTEYVTENSYVLIADVMKDAAKHDH